MNGENRLPRSSQVRRSTAETNIELRLNIDGDGSADVNTGIGFFDHMLNHVARHGGLDLTIVAQGDLHVDDHHTVEDVGIALGNALNVALGDRAGIVRYGNTILPMDEALILCAVDLSGRGLCVCDINIPVQRIGTFATEMTPEFFRAVAHNAGMTLHIQQLAGTNGHHIVEGAFKAFGRALMMAVEQSDRVKGVPSTKGVL